MRNFLRINNIRRTFYYLKKNGLLHTYYAVRERTAAKMQENYRFIAPTKETLLSQHKKSRDMTCRISIVVPLYNPKTEHFLAMVESVLAQSYPLFELILADAGENEEIAGHAARYIALDARIKYHRLPENKGISANTNAAIQYAAGDYIGLLDHDDLLTADALFEMAAAIEKALSSGNSLAFLYSDEDKFNGDSYFENHCKQKLNLDLILSNNYICHFLVIRSDIIKTLKLRPEYDGAQDYDLILRSIDMILGKAHNGSREEMIISTKHLKESVHHINKVLYHWRSHIGSTSENPRSKEYAYDAGKRAIEDFIRRRGYNGTVHHLRHLGYYRINYLPNIINQRPEVAVVGGKLINKNNKIAGGIYLSDGTCIYEGLHSEYSGYMHGAKLLQEAEAVDIRCMIISPAAEPIFEEIIGLPYLINPLTGRYNWNDELKKETDFKKISLSFCEKILTAGFTIVWDPQITEHLI